MIWNKITNSLSLSEAQKLIKIDTNMYEIFQYSGEIDTWYENMELYYMVDIPRFFGQSDISLYSMTKEEVKKVLYNWDKFYSKTDKPVVGFEIVQNTNYSRKFLSLSTIYILRIRDSDNFMFLNKYGVQIRKKDLLTITPVDFIRRLTKKG